MKKPLTRGFFMSAAAQAVLETVHRVFMHLLFLIF